VIVTVRRMILPMRLLYMRRQQSASDSSTRISQKIHEIFSLVLTVRSKEREIIKMQ
jgi:hypothetical protein